MNKKFGIGLLISCFLISGISLSPADTAMPTPPPVTVGPGEVEDLNQQMLDLDRRNRDEEIAIKNLVEQNDQLTQTTLARQEDEGLAKINATMLSYRNALYSRDRQRIMDNENWGSSRYGDLVALTEDADDMTVHHELVERSGYLADKYQMLSALKDEMSALNEKLASQDQNTNSQNLSTIDGFKKITEEQQVKIQSLVNQLGDMDQKISQLDANLQQKEEEIAQLRENLDHANQQIASRDLMIQQQKSQIANLQVSRGSTTISAQGITALAPIIVNPPGNSAVAPSTNLNMAPIIVNPSIQPIAPVTPPVNITPMTTNQVNTAPNIVRPNTVALPPVIGNPSVSQMPAVAALKAQLADRETLLNEKQAQVDLLRDELQNKIIDEQKLIREKGQSQPVDEAQVKYLRNKLLSLAADLKSKQDTILWLNQVLTVTKNKAQYYQLSSQLNQMPVKGLQKQVSQMKADFADHLNDYQRFQNTLAALKTELQNKEDQISRLKADIHAMHQAQENSENEIQNNNQKTDDRITLAKQLIALQQQEATLIEEKSDLEEAQGDSFERHFTDFEGKANAILANRRLHDMDKQVQIQGLEEQLDQTQKQAAALEAQLKDNIAQGKNQGLLSDEVQDLNTKIQEQDDQIAKLKIRIQAGQTSGDVQQQLAAAEDNATQLQQQLQAKIAQADQMTSMMSDYQKKLEDKDSAYNQELGQVLLLNKSRGAMQSQLNAMNLRLHEKEKDVLSLKRQVIALQSAANAQSTNLQEKDLDRSMQDQRVLGDYEQKINALQAANTTQVGQIVKLKHELATLKQGVKEGPSSDELLYLRTGLQKATVELKHKDVLLAQIRANADEYQKEFAKQSGEFASLKDQLADAQDMISKQNDDLKYKDMAIARLKLLMNQTGKDIKGGTKMPMKLIDAQARIKELQAEVDQLESFSRNDVETQKLKQALDKIIQQGNVINMLMQKLQACGQSVDLTKELGQSK